MTDVTELIIGDHERIRRLLTVLDDGARYGAGDGRMCPDWLLPAIWSRLASLLILHADAEQEICFVAMYGGHRNGCREFAEAVALLDDVRAAVAEARLFRPGDPAWWRAAEAARRSICDHIFATETGALAGFRSRTRAGLRRELGRQWAAFVAARRRDGEAEGYTGAIR
jgi:hypothetical protein